MTQIEHMALRRKKKIAAYKALSTVEWGGNIIDDLRAFCKIDEDLPPEPYSLAMAEGRRQVYRRIKRYIEMDETKHILQGDINE